jgi:hypothetical protein
VRDPEIDLMKTIIEYRLRDNSRSLGYTYGGTYKVLENDETPFIPNAGDTISLKICGIYHEVKVEKVEMKIVPWCPDPFGNRERQQVLLHLERSS